MNFPKTLGCILTLALTVSVLPAQTNSDVEQLREQLRVMQENFQKTVSQQQQQIEALSRQVETLRQNAPAAKAAPASSVNAALEAQLAAELGGTNLVSARTAPMDAAAPWSPSSPITVMRKGNAYMNVSFDAVIAAGYSTESDPSAALQLGDHDPVKRGFSLRNAEIALDGAIDPYFKGFANILLKMDQDNETEIELEEAYLQTTSLPGRLQVKAGQFFANFGRQNTQHPHQWGFVDAPIITARTLGPDGLRGIATQLSWVAPLPFYTELSLGIHDGQGGTAFSFRNAGDDDGTGVNRFSGRATAGRNLRGLQDFVYTPRLASSFELSDTQTLVAGLSGAFGHNDTGPHSRTEIYGADVYWKWKPANAGNGFPFVSWQSEAIYRRFGAGADATAAGPLPAENLRDFGFYSQVLWGFRPRWVTGLRGEYAVGNDGANDFADPFRGDRYRVSPVLTFYPSEFSKLRFQYNYDHGEFFGDAHSFWVQLEFLLGAHGAHKF